MPRPSQNQPTRQPLPQLTQARRFGRYWLLRLIARGGMGEVYLAATTGIEGAERPCVVKIIRREHAKDSSFVARFLDEARVQAQLHHPGVVQVIEAAKDEKGEPFVVVEFVEGRSLGEVRSRAMQVSYRLSWAEALALGTSTAEALAHIHERMDVTGEPLGIVHRDMSPQNIMVGYGGDVKLIDFGTALGENRRCHTVSGVVFAKPGYVAPEVANGNTGDARVDLYALGIIVWELAAGRRFLQGDSVEHLAKVAKNNNNPPPIAQLIGAPPELDSIIAKLTAFDIAKRYSSARDALRDMARVLSHAPSLSNGERGVRARISQVMGTLYPAEPTQSRRSFASLVAQARELEKSGQALLATGIPEEAAESVCEMSEPDARLLPGTRYRILRKIGEGAMGHVFEAEHIDLGRRVAIKVLAVEHATSPDYATRFRREARALSRLSHPNLVALHDFGQATDGRLYCAMEYLEGCTLEQRLASEGSLPWQDALRIGAQAASALHDAHGVGIIHRDLKPSNLFLCEDGTVKLLDFGVARKRGEASTHDVSSFTLYGTPEYMAPEQVSSGSVDEKADIYALGCVLYEAVTGRLPLVADSTVALLDAKMKRDPDCPRERAPSKAIPVEVDRLIMRALVRNPAKRTANARELLSQIQGAFDAPYRKRRQRRAVGRLALGATLLTAILGLSAGLARQYPEQVHLAMAALVAEPAAAQASPLFVPESFEVVRESSDDSLLACDSSPRLEVVASPSEMATAAAERGEWAASIDAARMWIAQENTKESHLFLAQVLIEDGQTEEARHVLEELNCLDPSCPKTRALLRRILDDGVQSAPVERVAQR